MLIHCMQESDLFDEQLIEVELPIVDKDKDRRVLLGGRSVDEYLNLHPISAVHLPIPLNFVLVGFDHDGNHNVHLSPEEVKVCCLQFRIMEAGQLRASSVKYNNSSKDLI
jgi:hypothetical protein